MQLGVPVTNMNHLGNKGGRMNNLENPILVILASMFITQEWQAGHTTSTMREITTSAKLLPSALPVLYWCELFVGELAIDWFEVIYKF